MGSNTWVFHITLRLTTVTVDTLFQPYNKQHGVGHVPDDARHLGPVAITVRVDDATTSAVVRQGHHVRAQRRSIQRTAQLLLRDHEHLRTDPENKLLSEYAERDCPAGHASQD